MGAVDFKSSRPRSPWRIVKTQRTVFGFSRSRTRAESRHCSSFRMGLRRVGLDGQCDAVDGRFKDTTAAMALQLRQEHKMAEILPPAISIAPPPQPSAKTQTNETGRESCERCRKSQPQRIIWIARGKGRDLQARIIDDRNMVVPSRFALEAAEERARRRSNRDTVADTRARFGRLMRNELLANTFATILLLASAAVLAFTSAMSRECDISNMKLWKCCGCRNTGMPVERDEECLVCEHERCEWCWTFRPVWEEERTNRFADVRHGGECWVSGRPFGVVRSVVDAMWEVLRLRGRMGERMGSGRRKAERETN